MAKFRNGDALWVTDLVALGRGASDEIKKLLRYAQDEGCWEGRRRPGGYIRLRHATGGFVSVAMTPSDWRTVANIRSDMRQAAQAERRH